MVVQNAERTDDGVNRFANGDTAAPQCAVVVGRRKSHLTPDQIDIRNFRKEVTRASVVGCSVETFEDLCEDEITDQNADRCYKRSRLITLGVSRRKISLSPFFAITHSRR